MRGILRFVAVSFFVAALFLCLGDALVFAQTDGNITLTPTVIDLAGAQFISFSGVIAAIAGMIQPVIVGVCVLGLALFCVRFFMRTVRGVGR
jgi:hypothetical protein